MIEIVGAAYRYPVFAAQSGNGDAQPDLEQREKSGAEYGNLHEGLFREFFHSLQPFTLGGMGEQVKGIEHEVLSLLSTEL